MEVKENITDSNMAVKESRAVDDLDEGIDLNSSNVDKVPDSSETKFEPEGTSENIESENDLENVIGIDNSIQESVRIADESDSEDEMFRKKPVQRKKAIVSDDEDSDDPLSQVSKKSNVENESSQKSTIESDKSDDESLSVKESKKKKKKMMRIINSDSEEESDMELFSKTDKSQSQESKSSYNRNIFDTEDSDEEERRSHHSDEDNKREMPKSKTKKPKEPTQKDREQERLEIASASQRMQREGTFSLPYHKPKQRTLTEFLNRKKTLNPVANTMRGSLKMSMRNPEILKQLESRKKEIEEFYKSDDEVAEDPEDEEWKPGMEPKKTDSDKDSDDSDMETDADKISETKVDTDLSEYKDKEMSLDAKELVVKSNNDIVFSESKDEKIDNTPGTILDDDELPDIDNMGKNLNLNGNEDPSEVSSTSKEENMEIEGRKHLIQLGNTEESKSEAEQMNLTKDKVTDELIKETSKSEIISEAEQMNLAEDKVTDELIKETSEAEQMILTEDKVTDDLIKEASKSEIISEAEQMNLAEDKVTDELIKETSNPKMISAASSKTLVDDSGIQSGASSSTEDHNSNEATVLQSTSIGNEKLAETNTQGDETTVAENIDCSKDVSLQGTPSLQNKDVYSSKNNTPKMALLAAKIPTLDLKATPKLGLGAGSGDFIDLDEDAGPKDRAGLHSFLDRFIKHSKTKRMKAGKRQVNLGVVQKVKGADGQETLESSSICVELEDDEDHTITEEVPGAKRVTLKHALKAKMREQREQERLRKLKEKRFMESEDLEGEDEAILDDGDITDKSETDYETESEPEENDVIIKDKKKKKNKFLDEEADEDEMEDDAEENDEDENDKDDAPINNDDDSNDTVVLGSRLNKKHTIDEGDSDTNGEELHLEWENTQDVNKGLLRTETQDMFASQHPKKIDGVDKDSSMTSMDSSFEFFGSVIPAHQPGGGMKNPQRSHLNSESQDNSNNGFLTPLLKQKTDSFGSVSKGYDLSLPFENSQDLCSTQSMSVNKEGSQSPVGVSLQLTPMNNSQNSKDSTSSPGSKLRLDFVGASQTQPGTTDELAGLCSGQFTGKTQVNKGDNLFDDEMAPTQNIEDLMGLCSGRFNTQTADDSDTKRIKERNWAFSQLFDSENKSTMEDDLIGLCTGKFTTQKDEVTKEGENSDAESKPRKMIIDSDDEDLIKKFGNKEQKKEKRKRKRIVAFGSDDEDDNAVDFVPDFDDEENEISKDVRFSGFKDSSTGGIRKDFLDAEAELSGSEDEVSDDEDEGGEDILEMEAGDAENYDDDELREQVGRAHMKAEMDADKRELRLLQEMYLEDGDLHGEGRQRSFRWRNNDNENADSNQRTVSDEEDHNEEEAEDADWRKERFEREKFLEEQKNKVKDDENEPEIFKIAAPLVRTKSLKSSKREPLKPSNPSVAPTNIPPTAASTRPTAPSNPFCMPTKRGSFLSRNKSTLAKIAELTKDKGSTVGGAKQGGNFVFQQLSAEEVEAQKEQADTKLNRSVSAPAMKRARLDRSFFSLDETKQKSSIFKHL